MAIHFFHCTDGWDLVLDWEGRPAASDADVFCAAADTALSMIGGLPFHDWAGWLVCVYDAQGCAVDVISFEALRAGGRARPIGCDALAAWSADAVAPRARRAAGEAPCEADVVGIATPSFNPRGSAPLH